jgi:hypothetical protein
MVSITIEKFVKSYVQSNKGESEKAIRESVEQAVQDKRAGTTCMQCKQPIWAIGRAVVGWDGCFTCITGEADSSVDYEIDSVNNI